MTTITVEIEGLKEVQEYLDKLVERASSEAFWGPILRTLSEDVRLSHTWGISPVITGSYRASHRTVVTGLQAVMAVDPRARNTDSGILVTRYMVPVEVRHHVYARSFAYARRMVANKVERIWRMFIG